MKSTGKTKHREDLLCFPHTNRAVTSNKIENLKSCGILQSITLLLKSQAIERLFIAVFHYDDTFIIHDSDEKSSNGSKLSPQDMLNILKSQLMPLCLAMRNVKLEEKLKGFDYCEFKDKDFTDIIDLYLEVDRCIRALII